MSVVRARLDEGRTIADSDIRALVDLIDTERRNLEGQIKDLQAKLQLVAPYVETEDGIFTFPDGDYLDGCAIVEK